MAFVPLRPGDARFHAKAAKIDRAVCRSFERSANYSVVAMEPITRSASFEHYRVPVNTTRCSRPEGGHRRHTLPVPVGARWPYACAATCQMLQ
eukprot:5839345-Pyramimonas_sp.AAC.1